ncbi:MAG: response regulator [Spirochaetales bacterium]|nr:response regulator [Spirochaetales bacterium]
MVEKTRILIVDDEQINLDFFDVMLSKLGFQVEKAQDGLEALEKVKKTNPDLIILDNIMPKLSGWKVTRLLKTGEEYREYRHIPIIMFSAMDDVKDKVEGFELGIEDYIIKPFNFSEVLARIRAVLRHRELEKRILAKERKITLIESLNKSLLYFTEHLKAPVLELMESAEKLDPAALEEVKAFTGLVKKETEATLAALKGLQDEISDLSRTIEAEQDVGFNVGDLDKKFQQHFSELQEAKEDLDGVTR